MSRTHFLIKVKVKKLKGVKVYHKSLGKRIYSLKNPSLVSLYKKPHFIVDRKSLKIKQSHNYLSETRFLL